LPILIRNGRNLLMLMIMKSPLPLRGIIVILFAINNLTNAFHAIPPTQLQRSISSLQRIRTRSNISLPNRHRTRTTILSESEAGRGSTGPKNDSTSKNEFSRTISVAKWFVGGGGGSSHRNSRKRMDLSISATSEECSALAKRFRLTNIMDISSDVTIQPALGVGGGGNGSGGAGGSKVDDGECVAASGTISAHVTQTCVRTNEEFDVNLEFSFETVLRAMRSSIGGTGVASNNDENKEPLSAGEFAALEAAAKLGNSGGGRSSRKKKGGKKRSGAKGVRGGQAIDDMGMKQLQDILMEYEVTDEIIEDEACFCTDGIVDCGEIVAQMFRSNLDPYPKKPGSDPVSYSFTF